MDTHKKYRNSHPWITFYLNLQTAHAFLWILLGEAQSKCEHIAGTPLRPETREKMYTLYLAKGVQATTAIEGNTLTEEQVIELLEKKLSLPPSKKYLEQEVDNIINGCNEILRNLKVEKSSLLTVELIKQFNKTVLTELSLDEGTIAGEIRTHSVVVGRYLGAPAEDCEFLLQELCDWLNGDTFKPRSEGFNIVYAILKATVAHLYIAWIHPFGDGNGRTARLLELYILIASGVPAPAAHLLSNHYNQTRTKYYQQLDRASKSGGDIIPFIHYAVEGLVDGLREQINYIRNQVWDITWRSHVHEFFKDQTSVVATRRRNLVLDISRLNESVKLDKILEISARVARFYAQTTPKTLARDLNELVKAKLLNKEPGNRYSAAKERILAFLPTRVE